MKISTRIVSNPSKLLKIEDAWNKLVDKFSKNPFCLSGFVDQFVKPYRSQAWAPLVLVSSTDNTIVGIAPLMTKKKLGVRFIRFAGRHWFPPDFIVGDQYRKIFIANTLDLLFKTLRCHFVDLTLSVESPNLRILKEQCRANRISFCAKPEMGHCIIPISCTWDEFEALRGRNFGRKFKRIGRHFDRAGSWRIICVSNVNEESDVFRRILDIEKMSWKEAWRTQMGMEMDQDLSMIWKAAHYTARTNPNFKWNVWFLELNDKPLAYALVLQYKKVAFFMKSSYDARYRKFSPGVYILNAAICELFNKKQVRNIDFLTDLPFQRIWTSMCLPRVRVMMSKKGILSSAVGSVLASAYITKILKVTENLLISRARAQNLM